MHLSWHGAMGNQSTRPQYDPTTLLDDELRTEKLKQFITHFASKFLSNTYSLTEHARACRYWWSI